MSLGRKQLGKPLVGWQYNGSAGERYNGRANAYWTFRKMSQTAAINRKATGVGNSMIGPFPCTQDGVVVLKNGIIQNFGTINEPRDLVFVTGNPETVAFYFTTDNEPADEDVVTVIL